MKDFELSIRLRNNRLKERRTQLGKKTRELAEAIGVSYETYIAFENLRIAPFGRLTERTGEVAWRPSALKIARFYGVNPEELWPNVIMRVVKPEVVTKVDAQRVLALAKEAAVIPELPGPDELYEQQEMREQLNIVLTHLTDREVEVVQLYYGLNGHEPETLSKIGRRFGLSREAVRQVLLKSLRHMRSPSLTQLIKPYLKK